MRRRARAAVVPEVGLRGNVETVREGLLVLEFDLMIHFANDGDGRSSAEFRGRQPVG